MHFFSKKNKGKELTSVLIIENDRDLQYLYEKILKNNGIQVIDVANSGVEAISIFKNLNEKPDIILMDYRMPLKNGIEIMREILSFNNQANIIIASGDSTIEQKALKNGAKMFLKKPFSCHKLVKEINNLKTKVVIST